MNKGKIVQIIGPVVGCGVRRQAARNLQRVDGGIHRAGARRPKLTLEVQQHLGDNLGAGYISMSSTEGFKRGIEVTDNGAPISMPVGEGVMGRVFNVTGEPVDEQGPVKADKYLPIQLAAAPLTDQSTSPQVLTTGIKVIDLISPVRERRQGRGIIGGAGVGKTVLTMELINNIAKSGNSAVFQCSRVSANARARAMIYVLGNGRGVMASSARRMKRGIYHSRRKRPAHPGAWFPHRPGLRPVMNEPAGERVCAWRLSALAVTEYFRDEKNQDAAAVH